MSGTVLMAIGPTAFAGFVWLVIGLTVAVFVYLSYALLQETAFSGSSVER